MHDWGDENVDWQGIDDAGQFIGGWLRKYTRMQVRDIKEKYGCYDDQTEVLTKVGWKYFKDVNIKEDEFATLVDNTNLEYVKATDYVNEDYEGKMYSLQTRGVDLLVTPNHNLYTAKGDIAGGVKNSGYKEFPYSLQNYIPLFQKRKKFKKGAKWKGDNISSFTLPKYESSWTPREDNNFKRSFIVEDLTLPIEHWLSFLGWFVAEGCVSKNSQCTLCLNGNNEEEINLVSSILDKLNFTYSVYKKESRAVITTYSKQLCLWLLEHCGHLAKNKKVPDFIKQLSPNLIEIFLKSLYLGDGHKTKTAHILSTVSETLANDVSELLLKAGYCARISKRDRTDIVTYINGRAVQGNFPEISVNWLQKNEHHTINSHTSKAQIEDQEKLVEYKGKVYCVSVPNKILYVRRNGKSVWCGNTVRIYCSFGWSTLQCITHPGYVYRQYKYGFVRLPRWINYIVVPIQTRLYRMRYKQAIKKWPHLREEILCSADYHELLEGL